MPCFLLRPSKKYWSVYLIKGEENEKNYDLCAFMCGTMCGSLRAD